MIRPHAADSGNIAIQFRTTAELGEALKLIQQESPPDYVLTDTTFSLPIVTDKTRSLFYEHLKRLCCVEAGKRKIGFFAISKSHGLPSVQDIEDIAREKQGLEKGLAEHWYLRIPISGMDNWSLSLTKGLTLPPVGAVTYLFRLHKTTPILRLDMDRDYWNSYVRGNSDGETRTNEQKIFEDMDYISHDQRAYGYPYPIKASHDRASLTKNERQSLKKLIIDTALQAGMKRSLFRDVSIATGHK